MNPFYDDAERQYLGSLLITLAKRESPTIQLKAEDFSDVTYKLIFEALLKQLDDPSIDTPNIFTLSHKLPNLTEPILELDRATVSDVNIGYFEKAILRESKKRRFLAETATAAERLKEYEADVEGIIGELTETLLEEAESGNAGLRYASAEGYTQECIEYDPSQDFFLFDEVRCPDGTLSYIGARPGGGKTTMMINIARDALARGRKAFFVNLEMSNKQIITNLILSSMYAAQGNALDGVANPLEQYYALFKADASAPKAFMTARQDAQNAVFGVIGDRLFIYDGIGSTLSGILMSIRSKTKPGDVVLIDYVQRLPVPATTQRYLEIKAASNALLQCAIRNSLVVIAGAQLNRKAEEGEASLADFREGGDIEADAHNAIAIERDYVHVLKAREGNSGYRIGLHWKKEYCYMQNTGAYSFQTNKQESPAGSAKKKGKVKKEYE